MAKTLLNPDEFGLKIYNRFPPRYLDADVEQDYSLKRYLDALAEGGFKYSVEELNGITYLIDPEKTPYEVLILLYEQYGLEIFHGVPEMYLRMLLPYLSLIYNKKGSIEAVEYLSTVLSGTRVETEVIYDEYDNADLNVKLEMDYALEGYAPDRSQMLRILKKFIPFYLGLVIRYAYVYYEEADINFVDDYFFDLIKETKDDTAKIYRVGTPAEDSAIFETGEVFGKAIFNNDGIEEYTEVFFDKVKPTREEIAEIKRPGTLENSAVFQIGSPFGEAIFNNGLLESHSDRVMQTSKRFAGEEKGLRTQDSSFSTIMRPSRKNATLGIGIIGRAVFNDTSTVAVVINED